MSRGFRALLWKEWMETRMVALPIPIVYMALFYLTRDMGASSGDLAPSTASFLAPGLMMLAFFLGLEQTRREAAADMWAFALHRPATGDEVFGAKLVAGATMLVVPMLVSGVAMMAWLSATGSALGVYWTQTVAECAAALTYWAAGLCAGSPRRSTAQAAIGFGVAVLGSVAAAFAPTVPMMIAVSLFLTPLVARGAKRAFTMNFRHWD